MPTALRTVPLLLPLVSVACEPKECREAPYITELWDQGDTGVPADWGFARVCGVATAGRCVRKGQLEVDDFVTQATGWNAPGGNRCVWTGDVRCGPSRGNEGSCCYVIDLAVDCP